MYVVSMKCDVVRHTSLLYSGVQMNGRTRERFTVQHDLHLGMLALCNYSLDKFLEQTMEFFSLNMRLCWGRPPSRLGATVSGMEYTIPPRLKPTWDPLPLLLCTDISGHTTDSPEAGHSVLSLGLTLLLLLATGCSNCRTRLLGKCFCTVLALPTPPPESGPAHGHLPGRASCCVSLEEY